MLRSLSLDDIAEVTSGAVVHGQGEETVTFVSTDTRTLPPGALFVALRGERHDGHNHVPAAKAAGAGAVMVERALHDPDVREIVVADTLRALGDVAGFVRDAFAGPVVAVTGSVGKTTVKEMIAHVLARAFVVHKSEANHNNEIGVPQTVFGLTDRHTALVLEMGMRGPGQITRLCEIAGPTIGVVTNVGLSHVELLGSPEAIADAKGELLQELPSEKGCAILPLGDAFFDRLRTRYHGPTLSCALDDPAADVSATDLARHKNGWRFTVSSPWGRTKMFLPSPGRFNVQNALFAIAVAGHLGVPLAAIAHALADWTAPAMRLEVVTTTTGVTLLSDAYNASPASMKGALETLRDVPKAVRRIAVLGEMRELGDFAEAGHEEVGRAAASANLDLLVCVGGAPANVLAEAARAAGLPETAVRVLASTEAAADILPALVQAGDAVLVKGSRALVMEKIVAALTGSNA
jgi:UDP-N-acetylmuramoyl-tripeptide--D-alanyl-D-alanine ligase